MKQYILLHRVEISEYKQCNQSKFFSMNRIEFCEDKTENKSFLK